MRLRAGIDPARLHDLDAALEEESFQALTARPRAAAEAAVIIPDANLLLYARDSSSPGTWSCAPPTSTPKRPRTASREPSRFQSVRRLRAAYFRLPNVGDRVRRVAGPVPLDARQVERRLDGQIPLEQMNDLPRFIVASAAVRSRSSSRSFRTASATSMRSSSSDVSM